MKETNPIKDKEIKTTDKPAMGTDVKVKNLKNGSEIDNESSKATNLGEEEDPGPVLVLAEEILNTEDVYRDTYIRYLGYANEIGEAFRPMVKRMVVNATYGVASAYVLADTWDKAKKASQRVGARSRDAVIAAGDTLLWQGFASIIIPGFTINRVTFFTTRLLQKGKVTKYANIIPTAVGLLSIPMIIKPIDNAVDLIMDRTYRKLLG